MSHFIALIIVITFWVAILSLFLFLIYCIWDEWPAKKAETYAILGAISISGVLFWALTTLGYK